MKTTLDSSGLDTFVRVRNLIGERILPFTKQTLYRKVREGSFPAPVKLSAGVSAWRIADVRAWQKAQAEASAK